MHACAPPACCCTHRLYGVARLWSSRWSWIAQGCPPRPVHRSVRLERARAALSDGVSLCTGRGGQPAPNPLRADSSFSESFGELRRHSGARRGSSTTSGAPHPIEHVPGAGSTLVSTGGLEGRRRRGPERAALGAQPDPKSSPFRDLGSMSAASEPRGKSATPRGCSLTCWARMSSDVCARPPQRATRRVGSTMSDRLPWV